ncbi:hypothetical protein [Microcystis phage Mel-JY34]
MAQDAQVRPALTLGQKQRIFTLNIARLIVWTYNEGYTLSFAEAYRTPEQAALNAKKGSGIARSLHTVRLAVDFNLFKDGKWLNKSEDFAALGEMWKRLHPLNRWGGDFKSRPDGNHFSMTHEGIS